MEYLSPVTDRTATDAARGTAKGFFNVSDWERIANNLTITRSAVEATHGVEISLVGDPAELMTPAITTVPTAEALNTLIQIIRALRSVAEFALMNNYAPRLRTFEPGKPGPNYEDANEWEKTLDIIYRAYAGGKAARRIRTGVGICGASFTIQGMFRK